jgi:hypothetical protein
MVPGKVVGPRHQGFASALTLPGRIDRDAANEEILRFALETQATNRAITDPGDRPSTVFQVVADGDFGFANRAARWVEGRVVREGELRESMDLGCGLWAARFDAQAPTLPSPARRGRVCLLVRRF